MILNTVLEDPDLDQKSTGVKVPQTLYTSRPQFLICFTLIKRALFFCGATGKIYNVKRRSYKNDVKMM